MAYFTGVRPLSRLTHSGIHLMPARPMRTKRMRILKTQHLQHQINRASFLALTILHGIIITIFLSEKKQPPQGGILLDLWVDHRHQLVYAFLALITLAPLLSVILFITSSRRRRKSKTILIITIWLIQTTLIFTQRPRQFTATAQVTWHHLIQPNLNHK